MSYDPMKNRRTAANLIIEETYPTSITPADYATALAHFGEAPEDGARGRGQCQSSMRRACPAMATGTFRIRGGVMMTMVVPSPR